MDIALRSTSGGGRGTVGAGLHHAVSLGNIEVSSKPTYSSQSDRNYDSEDENMGRRRLKHTLSTDLHPRTSVYSRGDIREQYCLTDRQLHSIERRPRRERFFGCLSRRGAQQSFLGGCVGRRVPSDENLAAYAPFQKYPRYQNAHYGNEDDKTVQTATAAAQHDMDGSSYFRRQPASILSTGSGNKLMMNEANPYTWVGSNSMTTSTTSNNNAESMAQQQQQQQLQQPGDQSSYHCPAYAGTIPPHQQGPATNPRTKHVSFARSHTLTSFDNVNAGFRSSGRLKNASSQERLIGGKKPIIATGSLYETIPFQQSATLPKTLYATTPINMQQHCLHAPMHGHQHHHAPIHIHQPLPDNLVGIGLPTLTLVPQPIHVPQSPEVVIVEKKFRNAMKTQATQTDVRKDGANNKIPLSPRALHRIKVVSQGAQTNGLLNGRKLTKSLSELPNGKMIDREVQYVEPYEIGGRGGGDLYRHDYLCRTQSQLDASMTDNLDMQQPLPLSDGQNNIMYYKPPPPLNIDGGFNMFEPVRRSSGTEKPVEYVNMAALNESFDYESNSLPRRTCTSHARTETDYYSNSLPRHSDSLHAHDVCKHITECSELMGDGNGVPLDFTRPHLLPPPREYCKNDDDDDDGDIDVDADEDEEEEEEEPPHETESYSSEVCVAPNRRMSMMTIIPPVEHDAPFRRDDIRRQSMPIYGQTEKLIDGFGPRSSFRHRDKVGTFEDEKEIFIDFKPHVSPKPSPKLQHKQKRVHKAELAKQRQAALVAQAFLASTGKLQQRTYERQQMRRRVEPPPPATPTPEPEEEPADEVVDYDDEEEEEEDDEEEDEEDVDGEDDGEKECPVYENIPQCLCRLAAEQQQQQQQQPLQQQRQEGDTVVDESREVKREQFRKRSVSLDDDYGVMEKKSVPRMPSTPASPSRDELLANASTYPSSDSLANDNTRDHSDGIWNESQATVLTAEQKDISDGSFSSNLLLTPSSKRKNLLLQHQQRSSIDTDAIDLEEQSPTYAMQTLPKIMKTPTTPLDRTPKIALAVPTQSTVIAPSIAVTITGTQTQTEHLQLERLLSSPVPKRTPYSGTLSRRTSIANENRKLEQLQKQRNQVDTSSNSFFTPPPEHAKSADISECSTNTDEYATCTDTSKRTPGIKTPPTTTSSSSTTQVPVSTQSSQLEKTQAGSSFESASSLYSVRGDGLSEELMQYDEGQSKQKPEYLKSPIGGSIAELARKSPSHSISSMSSGSYNIPGGKSLKSPGKEIEPKTIASTAAATKMTMATVTTRVDKPKIKPESISDDERSEKRYSSSGYYESPHEDDDMVITTTTTSAAKKGRHMRMDDERKRRKTTMKLDIEKENLRALTSPVKKVLSPQSINAEMQTKDLSPEENNAAVSPTKLKRFRPKMRRQLRRSSRDESTPRARQKKLSPTNVYGYPTKADSGETEVLLDASMSIKALSPTLKKGPITSKDVKEIQTHSLSKTIASTSPKPSPKDMQATKSSSQVCQLKAKSVESLRSVSPGSDSVFYSEADGGITGADPHSLCTHCGKEMEGKHSTVSELGVGDSVESLPYIEQDVVDIVKPPSDFADSPITTKTTQRLYKKMEKRFRSEERYHFERGRYYKIRRDSNKSTRAKSEERGRENEEECPEHLEASFTSSSPCVIPQRGREHLAYNIIYRGHYDKARYARLTDADVWNQLDRQVPKSDLKEGLRERRSSTDSEKGFRSKYQVILHRLIQRRCTLEMYERQEHNRFQLISSNSPPDSVRRKLEEVLKLMLLVWAREGHVISKLTNGAHGIDKTVTVNSDSGEFGFRIHGSKPVVVAAIEPDTPAENSGLEVGDIIICVNGIDVLDKHHTEVVKIAHSGCAVLILQVARTIGVLMHEKLEPPMKPVLTGYLWRQSGQAKGTPNLKKWVRRWFSLRPDNCLYYYKTEVDIQPVGAMIMAKHTVERCPPEVGKPHAFKIDSGEGIPMYVAADTEEIATKWIRMLKQAAILDNKWLDKCARILYKSPSSIQRPDCFGYLTKMDSKWCEWSRRYCVLKDACLYFYQDANSKNAFGMACLQGYKVISIPPAEGELDIAFEVLGPESKMRHFNFTTDTEMDKKRWISAFEYSIDRWIKSG